MLKSLSQFKSAEDMNSWVAEQKATLRQGGCLEGWVLDTETYYPEVVAFGHPVGDSRWGWTSLLRTSAIQYIDPEHKFIITLNTVYTLGEPRECQ